MSATSTQNNTHFAQFDLPRSAEQLPTKAYEAVSDETDLRNRHLVFPSYLAAMAVTSFAESSACLGRLLPSSVQVVHFEFTNAWNDSIKAITDSFSDFRNGIYLSIWAFFAVFSPASTKPVFLVARDKVRDEDAAAQDAAAGAGSQASTAPPASSTDAPTAESGSKE